MRDFCGLSGAWIGLSVQDGRRISEEITLQITGCAFSGSGNDADGRFAITGFYEPNSHIVTMQRVYTWTTSPGQAGAGIPYLYRGLWDGAMVSGRWSPSDDPWYGGPFEMWPGSEEDLQALSIRFEELVTSR